MKLIVILCLLSSTLYARGGGGGHSSSHSSSSHSSSSHTYRSVTPSYRPSVLKPKINNVRSLPSSIRSISRSSRNSYSPVIIHTYYINNESHLFRNLIIFNMLFGHHNQSTYIERQDDLPVCDNVKIFVNCKQSKK